MKNKCIAAVIAIFALMTSVNIHANEVVIGQKDKAFTKSNITIKVGDVVKFSNEDPFSHNVYSLSEIKSFDLGSYPKGESRTVTFSQPGQVEVGCAVHMDMMLVITVE